MVLMYLNTKELILRKVTSLYPANIIKTKFLHSFFLYLDFKEHRFPEQLKKQPPEVFYKKSCFKNFAVFTGKHLYWSLFLIKLQIRLNPRA